MPKPKTDPFSEAFDEASGLPGDDAEEVNEEELEQAPEEEAQDDQPAPETEEDSDAGDENDDQGDEAEEGEPAPNPQPEEAEGEDKQDEPTDFKTLYEKEKQRLRSLEGRFRTVVDESRAIRERLKEIETRSPKQDPGDKQPQDDDPDQQVLNEFLEEYPDLQKPITAMIRKNVERAIADFKSEALDPYARTVQEVASSNHTQKILAAHDDAFDIVNSGELDAWIESQPTIYQPQLRRVVDDGSTEEVIELLTLFKDQRGKPSAREAQTEDSDTSDKNHKDENLARQKKEKLAAAAAVPGRSGGAPAPKPRKDDFQGAWSEALKHADF